MMAPTASHSPIIWVYLNRYAYIGVQDRRIVAVAHWAPAGPGEQVESDHPAAERELVIVEPGYYLTLSDDPQGKGVSDGTEPTGEWPEEILWRAGRLFREWAKRTARG